MISKFLATTWPHFRNVRQNASKRGKKRDSSLSKGEVAHLLLINMRHVAEKTIPANQYVCPYVPLLIYGRIVFFLQPEVALHDDNDAMSQIL